MALEKLTEAVTGAAIKVQKALGPGMLESSYRMDLLVDDILVLELKTIEQLLPVHSAQLSTYLHFSGKPLGLLLNFWAWPLKDGGIKRVLNSR